MNKIYFIPGLGESCKLKRYQKLISSFTESGITITEFDPDWYKPVSTQVFPVDKSDVLIGFSFGAVLAYLIAKKYPCKKVILASLSPLNTFSLKSLIKDYAEHMSKDKATEISRDLKKIKIDLKSLKTPHISILGALEKLEKGETADIFVPKTGHKINERYIEVIKNLLN